MTRINMLRTIGCLLFIMWGTDAYSLNQFFPCPNGTEYQISGQAKTYRVWCSLTSANGGPLPHGYFYEWRKDGRILESRYYTKGELVNLIRFADTYIRRSGRFFPTLEYALIFKGEKLNGEQVIFAPDGKGSTVLFFKDGKLDPILKNKLGPEVLKKQIELEKWATESIKDNPDPKYASAFQLDEVAKLPINKGESVLLLRQSYATISYDAIHFNITEKDPGLSFRPAISISYQIIGKKELNHLLRPSFYSFGPFLDVKEMSKKQLNINDSKVAKGVIKTGLEWGVRLGTSDLFNIGSLRIGAHLFETRTGKQTANGTDETELKYDAFFGITAWREFLFAKKWAIPLVVGGDIILNKMYMGDYYASLGLRLYF